MKSIVKPIPQIPGCLPRGYDLDSLLTVAQFACWQQIAVSTARAKILGRVIGGAIVLSRECLRVHPRTFLERSAK